MNYELYREALKSLVAIERKHDFSPAGESEFENQLAEVKRLYWLACEEGQ